MTAQATEAPLTPITSRPAPLPATDGPPAPVLKMPVRHRSGARSDGAATQPLAAPTPLEAVRGEHELVAEMARRLGLAALEVLNGSRSVQQLARWLDPHSFEALAVRAQLTAAAYHAAERKLSCAGRDGVRQLRQQPTVHSVHASHVAPGIYETSLVVADTLRVRAMALRLEQANGRWRVTALQIG
ncbi:Rv3235 family protein [Specibacter cremeus]|uniref:Rv3235 family protein n=1 Tax=Specibacter cremeus TaxID=1629051 RepID=UPI000F78CD57|nr:Rv3235 family protein [Specibacter cremeus]